MQPFFTIPELASRWQVNHKTVRAMIDRGELPHFRVGKHIKVTSQSVLEHEGWSLNGIEESGPQSGLKMERRSGDHCELRVVSLQNSV